MRRKIFKKSNKSRIRSDLEFDPDEWWLRSVHVKLRGVVGFIIYNGEIYDLYAYNNYGVLPACMI